MSAAKALSRAKHPRRVQIIVSPGGYFRPGQYGYAVSRDARGGMHLVDRPGVPSPVGEPVFLVSKTKDMRGGAVWFSKSALRFTGRKRRRRARR